MRVLIVDDEPLARDRLARLLGEEPGVEVVGECANGREAVEAVRAESPDIVFLDVQMPELDGFGALAELGAARMPTVVFVSAYDQYAIRAFEVHALDYLLKPFDPDRFREAFRRAREQVVLRSAVRESGRLASLLAQLAEDHRLPASVGTAGGASAAPAAPPAPRARYLERMMVKSDGRIYFVKVAEVDWIEAAGNYVRVHVGRVAHLVRETMSAVESSLDPSLFARIHRGTIVNLDRIKEMQPWFGGDQIVILKDGQKLKLSRSYRGRLESRL